MAVYKVKAFDRFARKNGIADAYLSCAAIEVFQGVHEADLGGGVYKKRVARSGGGKSGGFRTFITHKTSEHLFFVYGFPKNQRDDIDQSELKALKAMARELGRLTQAQIDEAVESGEFVEVLHEGNEEDEGGQAPG